MGRVLLKYMSSRLNEVNLKTTKKDAGPVITISRAGGCSAYPICTKLEGKINAFYGSNKWQVISKEVLHQSAEMLKLHPEKIEEIAKLKERSLMEEILHAFLSSDYQLEKKVQKTIMNVIRRFAYEGHKIIMGRGGSFLCDDIKRSLHVRIDAPMDWKVERVMNNKGYSREQAIEYIEQLEADRRQFRQAVKGKKSKCDMFDLTLNQSKFTDDEIVEMIFFAAKMKGLLTD